MMCSYESMNVTSTSRKTFDQKVRELSAEYGVYDIPHMAQIMGIPLNDAQKMIDPRIPRYKQPTPWFQNMFLELYRRTLTPAQSLSGSMPFWPRK